MTLFVKDLDPARDQGDVGWDEGNGDDHGPGPHGDTPPASPPFRADKPTRRRDGMVNGVIPEQLAEEVVPDWLDEQFRLLRERSEQNRMHMPGGDYHRLHWWSLVSGRGETGLISYPQQETPLVP
jgi:hypothetical protein